ncbi:hypothetical protein [Vibrio phage VpKK5]|uniref:hypothetical protein n=1 Tax=Vibrio phage VpKK5 TaxID=1538804 RepID=UPI0004F89C7D|nr:hypothetical protein VC55_gp36 [Vibrio phage VpKK5]AIM40621.1 hypothetical protein [Vibrio phage VpKK5]
MNAFLNDGEVVVATEDRFNDNDGSYHLAYIWNGVSLRTLNYSNGYNNVPFDAAQVDATPEQKEAAAEWYASTIKPSHGRLSTFIGHQYLVKRSRKIKKGTKVVVRNVSDRMYNPRFNTYDPERALVEVVDTTEHHEAGYCCWISLGCLDEWVHGARPWWA